MTIDSYMDQALSRWVDRKPKPGIVWLRILPIPEMVQYAVGGATAVPRMQWIRWKYSLRFNLRDDKGNVPAKVEEQKPPVDGATRKTK